MNIEETQQELKRFTQEASDELAVGYCLNGFGSRLNVESIIRHKIESTSEFKVLDFKWEESKVTIMIQPPVQLKYIEVKFAVDTKTGEVV